MHQILIHPSSLDLSGWAPQDGERLYTALHGSGRAGRTPRPGGAAQRAPSRAVPYNPVEERLFKADVMPRLLAFDPFVPEDLLTLSQKLFVKKRILDQVISGGTGTSASAVRGGCHGVGRAESISGELNR